MDRFGTAPAARAVPSIATMQIRIANAPTSWGVEDPEDGANPRWDRLLSQIAKPGTTARSSARSATSRRSRRRSGTSSPSASSSWSAAMSSSRCTRSRVRPRAFGVARRTCELLRAAGAVHLVIIQGFTAARERAAGPPGLGPAAGGPRVADDDRRRQGTRPDSRRRHGLIPVFHPHAGTHVEFEDEIDRLAADTDVPLCIDTGHCAYAGIDPVALYRRHADRVAYFHLKDVDRGRLDDVLAQELCFEQAVGERVFCPSGRGSWTSPLSPLPSTERDFHGWATVEQDRLPNDSTGRPSTPPRASPICTRPVSRERSHRSPDRGSGARPLPGLPVERARRRPPARSPGHLRHLRPRQRLRARPSTRGGRRA